MRPPGVPPPPCFMFGQNMLCIVCPEALKARSREIPRTSIPAKPVCLAFSNLSRAALAPLTYARWGLSWCNVMIFSEIVGSRALYLYGRFGSEYLFPGMRGG